MAGLEQPRALVKREFRYRFFFMYVRYAISRKQV